MISRGTLALDRLAALILALALIIGGVLGLWWATDLSPLPTRIDTSAASRAVAHDWWPWVSAAVGVVLILLGLRWLAAHIRRTTVAHLTLTGSGPEGRLRADAPKVAAAAAAAFSNTLGVRDAKGTVRRDRGQLVAKLIATIELDSDLTDLAQKADRTSAELAHVLERDDLRFNLELRVPHRLTLPAIS